MKGYVFINRGYTFAIESFLANKRQPEGKNFNSFLVVTLRLLMQIYDELDILTPYNLKSEMALYDNLTKYGYPLESAKIFLNLINHFYENENGKDFIEIQKMLIDMLGKKKETFDLTEKELLDFKNLLYCNSNFFQIAYNFKFGIKNNEILDYFNSVIDTHQRVKSVTKEKETLNLDAYQILNYSIEDVMKMDAEELDGVNDKVYEYFDVNKNAINKNYLLDKAINEFNSPKPVYSTGNGFVDILFILGIIATVIMVILIITFIVL